jgi:hypothetical protein
MSFTYDFTTQPLLSRVRMLIPDTVDVGHVFEDEEVNEAIFMESSQGLYSSGMADTTGLSVQPPIQVYSIRRAAAVLVDIMAGRAGAQAIVEQILDVKLSAKAVSDALHAYATCLRETEANSGAFAIAEWVVDPFSARERVYKQILRLYPG